MKKFVDNALAILMCLIGFMAIGMSIVGLFDPEGVDKIVFGFCVIFAVVSFLVAWRLWKPSR